MRTHFSKFLTFGLLVASSALSHSGVKDPQVMARMQLMTAVAKDMKMLGAIARGTEMFDQTVVSNTAAALVAHSSQIAPLFESQATDPKSEAKDTIWSDFDGFVAQAKAMEDVAAQVAASEDLATLRSRFAELGKTCTSCHEGYRIKK